MANRAVSPKGDAKEDWAILRAISAKVDRVLPYDSQDELRQKLFEDHPSFMSLDTAPGRVEFNASALGRAGKLSTDTLKNPIEDFYMTNPIARASDVMAECSAIAEAHAGKVKEAAE